MRTRLSFVSFLAVLAAVLAAAGCGSSNNSTSSTSKGGELTATPGITQKKDSKVAALVPKAIASKGTLTFAEDATYPPDEYIGPDGHTVIGMDADLAKALGELMGLKTTVKNVTFDAIIPGLAAKKYDVGASSFTITKDREKTVDFVSYLTAGTSFYSKVGGPKLKTLADLCGHSAAVEKGTTQEIAINDQNKKCKSQGKPGIDLKVLPDQNAANLAISSGREELGAADTPVAVYIVDKSNGQFQVASPPLPPEAYGIAVPKGSGLTKPIQAALKVLIGNGAYGKILKYWGLEAGALTKPQIDPTKGVPAS